MKNQQTNRIKNVTFIAVLLIILGVAARFFPHPPNFAPIAAIALFGGLYLNKKIAFVLPIAAMLVSDLFIGFYSWKMMAAVYLSFILMVGIGLLVKRNKKFSTILGGTLLGSLLFFLITNAAVWIFGTMYPHTIAGLITSYTMAIPFFKNTLMGNIFFVGVLIGSMEMIIVLKDRLLSGKVRI
ncbi:hypothetical protein HN682_02235 [Candidatus Peregrinibacteria bacterium]|jgi:hypothetical protein|nr:hypothetical protein [Candidatus Peregrinibacteria bacterium]